MDIFKMASQIANNMSDDDKSAIENMDMENMISHVTKNVFKMMNGGSDAGAPEGLSDLIGKTQYAWVLEFNPGCAGLMNNPMPMNCSKPIDKPINVIAFIFITLI